MSGHEIDDLRSYISGCSNKVALIFPVLIIYYDDQFAISDIFNGLFYGMQFEFTHCFVFTFLAVGFQALVLMPFIYFQSPASRARFIRKK